MQLAFSAVNGFIGRHETSSASFSLNSILSIENNSSEGGAPWGKRLSLSDNLE